VHCKNAIRRQIWHSLGQVDQGCDVVDSVSVGLPGKRSWGRRVPVGPGGPRGQWAMLSTGGTGHSLQGSTMGWGERGSLGLGSHFVSGSAGGVWGATQGSEKSPTLRGEHRGIRGVFKWHGVPSVVSSNPVKD
jgi:hypothetical protein